MLFRVTAIVFVHYNSMQKFNGCWLLIKFPRFLPKFEYFETQLVPDTASVLLVSEVYGCYSFETIGLKVFQDIYQFDLFDMLTLHALYFPLK
jgi:uncharacterized membrane protein